MDKKSFVIYENWCKLFCDLPDEEAGILIKLICDYKLNNENKEENKAYLEKNKTISAIFNMIKITLDTDEEKYKEICEKRRNSGSMGGKQKVANGKQMVANATNNVANGSKWVANRSYNDNDNDNINNSGGNIRVAKVKRIVNLYHQYCPSLPKVLRLTEKRMKIIEDRLSEYTEEELIEIFKKVEGNSFLREGSKKWKGADFDFIMDKEKIVKISEGFYEWGGNKGIQKSKYDFAALQKMIDGG